MSSEMLRIALVGNPNCGKTSLFNALTGTKQKVANYAGATVERKEGFFILPSGREVRILDLPGTYSLDAASPDEAVTRDVCLGVLESEKHQDAFLCIIDATNLKLHLNLLLEVIALKRPVVIALNMMDEARRRGIQIDANKLSALLGVPVVETVAVKKGGVQYLIQALEQEHFQISNFESSGNIHQDIKHIFKQAVSLSNDDRRTAWLDRIFLHPVMGLLLLAAIMFIIFQAVYFWAAPFMDWIEAFFSWFGEFAGEHISHPLLHSLIVDGVIAGASSIVVFLPQILILFFFIFVLEESGYLPRAAFLLDKLMFKAGLSGRAFIPLLSSFACAVPGIMAARSINDPRDRLTTIMVAPLMTCSARLPVYTLLIGAFIPQKNVFGFFNLQGLVLFGLYFAGIISALIVAYIIKLLGKDKKEHALLMELPSYRFPDMRNVLLGVYERAKIFLRRVGTILFAVSVLLWFLCTFPSPPENATRPDIDYSFAGMIGSVIQPLFSPLGFPWQLVIALIPTMAAREVVITSLATVYSVAGKDDDAKAESLSTLISNPETGWGLATGLALLVWFIYAPHCLSTLATIRRETNSWLTVGIVAVYLFGLAYFMALITYQISSRVFGW